MPCEDNWQHEKSERVLSDRTS